MQTDLRQGLLGCEPLGIPGWTPWQAVRGRDTPSRFRTVEWIRREDPGRGRKRASIRHDFDDPVQIDRRNRPNGETGRNGRPAVSDGEATSAAVERAPDYLTSLG